MTIFWQPAVPWRRAKLKVAGVAALLELEGLGGRDALAGYRVETLSLVSE